MRGNGPVSECMVGLYHILMQPTRRSGGAYVSSPSGVRKRFLDVLYAVLCDFTYVLVHFGS